MINSDELSVDTTAALKASECDTGVHGPQRKIARVTWSKPCEAMFVHLAEHNPQELIEYLHSRTISTGMRARAARAAGRIKDSAFALRILRSLLDDTQPMVQEGAVQGLAANGTDEAKRILAQVAHDSKVHRGVREAAMDALDLG
ncbi:HEAT repeat domain-containing protein [Sorangium sp. So ce119]|uniref:HEAT repeat domain-containing protein n=1 Tax=Sorangium sp. So ce119 TaxID=3133279 RepID=UPI003F63DA2B